MADLSCYDHILRQLCPDGHCGTEERFRNTPHDATTVDLSMVPPAVSMYHGRALCLECLVDYVNG
jgi:hypothetical protein